MIKCFLGKVRNLFAAKRQPKREFRIEPKPQPDLEFESKRYRMYSRQQKKTHGMACRRASRQIGFKPKRGKK